MEGRLGLWRQEVPVHEEGPRGDQAAAPGEGSGPQIGRFEGNTGDVTIYPMAPEEAVGKVGKGSQERPGGSGDSSQEAGAEISCPPRQGVGRALPEKTSTATPVGGAPD